MRILVKTMLHNLQPVMVSLVYLQVRTNTPHSVFIANLNVIFVEASAEQNVNGALLIMYTNYGMKPQYSRLIKTKGCFIYIYTIPEYTLMFPISILSGLENWICYILTHYNIAAYGRSIYICIPIRMYKPSLSECFNVMCKVWSLYQDAVYTAQTFLIKDGNMGTTK